MSTNFSRIPKAAGPSLMIHGGLLCYCRINGTLSCIELDALMSVELRALRENIYWHLQDELGNFVLVPEATPGVDLLRRHLSSWRGFDYTGLCGFDPQRQQRLALWPLLARSAAA